MCKCIDSTCLSIFNVITIVFEYLLVPFKYLLHYPLKYFERQYSFMMIINFLILIIPFLLNTVMIKQYKDKITTDVTFAVIFYLSYSLLFINYYFTFQIYEKYGLHKLFTMKYNFKVGSFMSFLGNYLFKEHKIGIIIILYLIQIPLFSVLLSIYLKNNFNNIEEVLKSFTFYGLICNLSFLIIHFLIYFTLFLVILCKINNSCLCQIICINSKNHHDKEKPHHVKVNSNAILINNIKVSNDSKSHNDKNIINDLPNDSHIIAPIERMLNFFKYIKIFDYEKEFGDGEKILDKIED